MKKLPLARTALGIWLILESVAALNHGRGKLGGDAAQGVFRIAVMTSRSRHGPRLYWPR